MFFRRKTPPYKPTGQVLVVPRDALRVMQNGLDLYRKARVEGCCFWYGPKEDIDRITITHVVFPKQINSWGHFTVPADAVVEMSAATRPLGLLNRAQIHTHPGYSVVHSWYDDDHAISRRAMSVVLPHYGATVMSWPAGIGVHAWQDNAWCMLTGVQVVGSIHIVEADLRVIDLR